MKDDAARIKNIIYYCNEIEESLNYFGKDEIEFVENRRFQHDCSFSISQIGESVNSLIKSSPKLIEKYPEIMWRDIVGIRNVIAHKYEGIELDTVWTVVTEDVPVLKAACERILMERSLE